MDTQKFWSDRYDNQLTGWDIGYPSTPIKEYFDQVKDKSLRILIPGSGNAYEAEYLHQQGFTNVFVLDIAAQPLENLAKRVPTFPNENLIQADFFEHQGEYDIILEQTFFCSFPPTKNNRKAYAKQMANLLPKGGKLVGLWFSFPLYDKSRNGSLHSPPYGGSKKEYFEYFQSFFKMRTFEPCYNSIRPRQGNEFFGLMIRSF